MARVSPTTQLLTLVPNLGKYLIKPPSRTTIMSDNIKKELPYLVVFLNEVTVGDMA